MEASLRLQRAVGVSAIVGFLVPAVFQIIFAIIEIGKIRLDQQTDYLFFILRTYLWPTSFGMLILDGTPNWSVYSLLTVLLLAILNIPIYMTIGVLCWLVAKAARRLAGSLNPSP
jgi:hypothetical protein